jgi:hypothetical protein
MSTHLFSYQSVRYFFAALVVCLILLAYPARAKADDRGTVGIFFAQLFDDGRQPDHRGPLVVLPISGKPLRM